MAHHLAVGERRCYTNVTPPEADADLEQDPFNGVRYRSKGAIKRDQGSSRRGPWECSLHATG
eukprot:940326-Prorocentrum_minimum.AAC.3